MKRAVFLTITLLAIVLIAGPAHPFGGKKSGSLMITGTIHSGGSASATGALGITRLSCRCSLTIKDDSQVWSFKEEPVIDGVDPNGPSAGILEDGDVLVSIDGFLITTRKGGRRFGSIAAGEEVEVKVRRGERTITRSVVAVAAESSTSRGTTLDSALASDLERLSVQVEELSRYAASLSVYIDSTEIPELPELPRLPELPDLPELPQLPDGSYGFNLSFSGSIHSRGADKAARWQFDSPPTISSVDPDGPAARAGLKKGDKITHIDGVPIDSREGGIRFSEVEPGQSVTWTIRRHREKMQITVVAEEREHVRTRE